MDSALFGDEASSRTTVPLAKRKLLLLAVLLVTLAPLTAQATGRRFARQRAFRQRSRVVFVEPRQVFLAPQPVYVQPLHAPQFQLRSFGHFNEQIFIFR